MLKKIRDSAYKNQSVWRLGKPLLPFIFFLTTYFLLPAPCLYAGSNNMKVSYQGFLKQNGAPVTATKGFVFRIRDGAAGAIQWQSACTNVVVSSGLFKAVLSSETGSGWEAINWTSIDAHLEIVVGDADTCGGDTAVLSPARQLMSHPYSFTASSAGAVLPDTVTSALMASDAGGLEKVTGGLMRVSGTSVGISSSAPVSKLAVEGGTITASGFVISGTGKFEGDGASPSKTIIFYAGTTCPSGWAEIVAARGRYLVGLNSGGNLAAVVGDDLSDQENRPAGQHIHTTNMNDPGHLHSVTRTTTDNCSPNGGGNPNSVSSRNTSSNTTGISVTLNNPTGSIAGTPAPYIQYLVCEKQ